jgi:hypothetical protein
VNLRRSPKAGRQGWREGTDRPNGLGDAEVDIGPIVLVDDEREYQDYLSTLKGVLSRITAASSQLP